MTRTSPVLKPNFATRSIEPALSWVALVSCAGYAFAELLFPDASRYAEGLLLLATLIALGLGKRNATLFWPLVMLGAALVLETTSWLASFQAADYGFEPDSGPRLDRISKWFLFLVLAFWLPSSRRAVTAFWASAVVAFALTPWIAGEGWQEIQTALNGARIDAGTMNAQHAAMMAGTLLIGAVCLMIHGNTSRPRKPDFILAGVSLAVLAAFFLYATQTRGVWLGAVMGTMTVLALYVFWPPSSARTQPGRKRTALIITLLLSVGLAMTLNTQLSEKLERESSSATLALEGRFSELPYDSTGIRLRSWYYALPWIAENPWFGWGPEGSKVIMQESDALPPALKVHFGHLHSTYLDVLAQYGLAGLSLLIALGAWFAGSLIQANRRGVIPYAAFLMGMGFLVYWLVVNAFESYMLFSSGKYVFTIVLAGILSLMPTTRTAKPAST